MITKALSVSIREEGGRDVHLQSVTGVLWDTRSMQDMHAAPAILSSDDIRVAVGTSAVPAHGQLSIPYKLGFTIVQPHIGGPIKAMVHVRGLDTADNVIETDCEAF